MKVIHLITTIDRGGAELHVMALAKEQRSLGVDVTIIPLKGKLELTGEIEKSRISTITSLANRHPLIQYLSLVRLVLTQSRETLIHAHLPRSELFASFLPINRKRIVISKHNAEPLIPNQFPLLSILLSKWVYFRSGLVISISNAVREFLVASGQVPLNAKRVITIPYGFDWTDRKLSASKMELEKLAKDEISILSVARLVPQKNLQTLLEAIYLLKVESFHFDCTIIGEGPLRLNLETFIKNKNLQENVHLVGRHQDPFSLSNYGDIFVLPSIYEGFGLVIFEAIAAGMKIVVSNIPIFSEILGHDYPFKFNVDEPWALKKQILLIKDTSIENLEPWYRRVRSKFSVTQMAEQIIVSYERQLSHY